MGQGLLRADGVAARKWRTWAVAAPLSLLLWLGLTALTIRFGNAAPLPLTIFAYVAYAIAGAFGVLFALGFCLRFGAGSRWPGVAPMSDNALGIYILHYAPVVWLQFALLDFAWPAPLKAAAVFCGAIVCCLVVTTGAGRLRRLVEAARRPTPPRLAAQAELQR